MQVFQDEDERASLAQSAEEVEHRLEQVRARRRNAWGIDREAGDQTPEYSRNGRGHRSFRDELAEDPSAKGAKGRPRSPRGRQPPRSVIASASAQNSVSRRVLPTPASPPTEQEIRTTGSGLIEQVGQAFRLVAAADEARGTLAFHLPSMHPGPNEGSRPARTRPDRGDPRYQASS